MLLQDSAIAVPEARLREARAFFYAFSDHPNRLGVKSVFGSARVFVVSVTIQRMFLSSFKSLLLRGMVSCARTA